VAESVTCNLVNLPATCPTRPSIWSCGALLDVRHAAGGSLLNHSEWSSSGNAGRAEGRQTCALPMRQLL